MEPVTKSIEKILDRLPSNPNPGFGIVLIWLLLRQDTGGRAKRCDSDQEDLTIAAKMIVQTGNVLASLGLILHAQQTEPLREVCNDEVLAAIPPRVATKIHEEILGAATSTLLGMKTDRQRRFHVRDYIAQIPCTNPQDAAEKPQEPQPTSK
ncbi:MAG: hypothetical protein WC080_02395 [Patescibacteria group bacterium]